VVVPTWALLQVLLRIDRALVVGPQLPRGAAELAATPLQPAYAGTRGDYVGYWMHANGGSRGDVIW
jgi:hypothetical protein